MTGPRGRSAEIVQDVIARVPFALEVVTLVTADGGPGGMTISSLALLSMDPPSVSMAIGSQAALREEFVVGRRLCVNILGAGQVGESFGFSYGTEDPFEVFDWEPAPDGTPILGGTAGYLLCDIEQVVDHHGTSVVLAGVVGGATRSDETLVYRMRRYYAHLGEPVSDMRGSW
ncbi:MAG: flavin reductase family protein [Actinomycetota bacterium]